jgi:hypothetical protein
VSTHERLLQNSWGMMALPSADEIRLVKEKTTVAERITA